jgi:hypothetical protein
VAARVKERAHGKMFAARRIFRRVAYRSRGSLFAFDHSEIDHHAVGLVEIDVEFALGDAAKDEAGSPVTSRKLEVLDARAREIGVAPGLDVEVIVGERESPASSISWGAKNRRSPARSLRAACTAQSVRTPRDHRAT